MNKLNFKERRETPSVKVGNVFIGSKHPIAVQSMTLADTSDVKSTVKEAFELYNAGSDLVRMTVKDTDHAKKIPVIKEELMKLGCDVPLIGDFHFEGHKNLVKIPECAEALDKWRINPGNAGKFDRSKLESEDFLGTWTSLQPKEMAEYIHTLSERFHDPDFKNFLELAQRYNTPVRIGVNSGSINSVKGSLGSFITTKLMDENAKLSKPKSTMEIEAISMAMAALVAVDLARRYGMPDNLMLVSTKSSEIEPMVSAYRMFAERSNIALHVGLTEAGAGVQGAVYTAIAQSRLLIDGIGDTFRTSLSPTPGQPRTTEVGVQHSILHHQSGYYNFENKAHRSSTYDREVETAVRALEVFTNESTELQIRDYFGLNLNQQQKISKLMNKVLPVVSTVNEALRKTILQALELMPLEFKVTACPGCGRTNRDEFIKLRQEIEDHVEVRKAELSAMGVYIENLKIASMGCVVNGPGEAEKADIAFVLPGKGEKPTVLAFVEGKKVKSIKADDYKTIRKECLELVDKYIHDRYLSHVEVA